MDRRKSILCIVVLIAGVFCLGVLAQTLPESQNIPPPMAQSYEGLYSNEDGASVFISDCMEGTWVMQYQKTDARPMVIYLQGKPENLEPVGAQVKAFLNGRESDLMMNGDMIYTKFTAGEGIEVEQVKEGSLTRRLSKGDTDLPADTPELAECDMAMGDYGTEWQRIRRSRVALSTNEVVIRNDSSDASGIPLQRQRKILDQERESLQADYTRRQAVLLRSREILKDAGGANP